MSPNLSKSTSKKGGSVLGRGLGNLLSTETGVVSQKKEQGIIDIEINKIRTSKKNPRKKFDQTSIEELSSTIKEHGLLQPILVIAESSAEEEGYTVISGERRLRACRLLSLPTVPCVIKKYSERQKLEVSLIENIQREQLDAIEEASVYKNLMTEYELTQEELSRRVGKNRATIANRIRLLQLPWELQAALADGRLTEGQVRPVLSLRDNHTLEKITKLILSRSLSARQVEEMVRDQKKKPAAPTASAKGESPDPNILSLEEVLQEALGLRVKIQHKSPKNQGKIILEYFNLDDLDRIVTKLKK